MIVPTLPATLAPPAPFPLVVSQSRSVEFVAPGIERATYRLQTSQGPLVISIVAIDPREPTVRFDSVVASDRMISAGETVSSMARRTNAVAGVNADYFDIGNTNQPLNVVVKDGALLRTPSKRIALDVRSDKTVRFENFSFSGSVTYDSANVPLTAVNEWPPQGGASFLNASYGMLKTAPGVSTVELVPIENVAYRTDVAGTYRVASVEASSAHAIALPTLAFGPAALAIAPLPAPGDTVTVAATLAPALDGMTAAVGGGPLLVANGAAFDDPNSPAPEESPVRFPVSGAARLANGEIVFAAVDGRAPAVSIGLTRPEFAALFLGLAATDAMAFDSGGSATLVARVLGDKTASVLNAPSDGEERNVADGLFVYSDAPVGPPAQIVVRPAAIVALPHTSVPVKLTFVDAAGHALGPAHLATGDAIDSGAASRVRTVRAQGLRGQVRVDVVTRIARLDVSSDARNPDPGDDVRLIATGYDDRGRPVELGDAVHWSAGASNVAEPGTFHVPAHDTHVVATAAGARGDFELLVGRRTVALPFFDASHASAWRFASAPPKTGGSVAVDPSDGHLDLGYDFSDGQRAAYADTDLALPGEPQSFSIEVRGDGNGAGIRAAFVNKFGERRALTLAKSVDWSGWKVQTIALPDDLNPPVRLVSLYTVDTLANAATHATGVLGFRRPSVTVAGTP